jgi:hypothetical protein
MVAIGAKYRLREGKILHLGSLWKSPSKRRIPRIMIEERALEVGIKMYLDGLWMVFEETTQASNEIDTKDSIMCTAYFKQYNLLPATIHNKDTYNWLTQDGNALLLWGKDGKYFVKPTTH